MGKTSGNKKNRKASKKQNVVAQSNESPAKVENNETSHGTANQVPVPSKQAQGPEDSASEENGTGQKKFEVMTAGSKFCIVDRSGHLKNMKIEFGDVQAEWDALIGYKGEQEGDKK